MVDWHDNLDDMENVWYHISYTAKVAYMLPGFCGGMVMYLQINKEEQDKFKRDTEMSS